MSAAPKKRSNMITGLLALCIVCSTETATAISANIPGNSVHRSPNGSVAHFLQEQTDSYLLIMKGYLTATHSETLPFRVTCTEDTTTYLLSTDSPALRAAATALADSGDIALIHGNFVLHNGDFVIETTSIAAHQPRDDAPSFADCIRAQELIHNRIDHLLVGSSTSIAPDGECGLQLLFESDRQHQAYIAYTVNDPELSADRFFLSTAGSVVVIAIERNISGRIIPYPTIGISN